jgi:hypothetical protein
MRKRERHLRRPNLQQIVVRRLLTRDARFSNFLQASGPWPICNTFTDIVKEIRNHIYHFASEASHYDGWRNPAPLLKHLKHGEEHLHLAIPGQPVIKFLGLTQVCKQVQTEYRLLWLRNLCIRLRIQDVAPYVDTYYPGGIDHVNAPKLLQISWRHSGIAVAFRIDLTTLFRIRANCPSMKAEFIFHDLTYSRRTSSDDELGWFYEQLPGESYLDHINTFLATENSAWLDDIRERRIAGIFYRRKFLRAVVRAYGITSITQRHWVDVMLIKGGMVQSLAKINAENPSTNRTERYLAHVGFPDGRFLGWDELPVFVYERI